MEPTTTGRFRVLDRRDAAGGATYLLVELPDDPAAAADPSAAEPAAFEPVSARAGGPGSDSASASDTPLDPTPEPGNVIGTTLAWPDDGDHAHARIVSAEIERDSRLYAADEVTGLFEAATETWREARAAGEPMASTVTRASDGTPNGALYAFADPPGRDLLAELRDGRLPVEPLIARVNATQGPAPREVFLLRPAAGGYVIVYVAFERDGILARTVRDTYGLGGPTGLAAALDAADPDPDPNSAAGSGSGSGSGSASGSGSGSGSARNPDQAPDPGLNFDPSERVEDGNEAVEDGDDGD